MHDELLKRVKGLSDWFKAGADLMTAFNLEDDEDAEGQRISAQALYVAHLATERVIRGEPFPGFLELQTDVQAAVRALEDDARKRGHGLYS